MPGHRVRVVESSSKNRDPGFPAGSDRSDHSSLELVGFAADVLAAFGDGGESADETVERAVRRYLDDARLRPAGWAVPAGLAEAGATDRSAVTVALTAPSLSAIAAEAEAQGVATETLVGHAVMYLWALERSPDSGVAASISVPAVPPPGRRRVSPRTSGG